MGDRRVLVVVSPELAAFGYDGAGSFANLQDAVDAVPLNNQVRTIIRIAPGVHRQLVHIPISQDQELHLIKDTVICCDNTAARIKHTQEKLLAMKYIFSKEQWCALQFFESERSDKPDWDYFGCSATTHRIHQK